MDIHDKFASSKAFHAIKSIDMHTTGEPTRIVYEGFPDLKGTLLEQRETASKSYDNLRKRIMLEPRGHFDMYGAILRPDTELTRSGQADIGVLFTHNGGFSTMCGHATIALGRFLVDTTDECAFPNRSNLAFDSTTQTVQIRLHAPCGVVLITAPTNADGTESDANRPVSFLSTPSFASRINLEIDLPPNICWKELGCKKSLRLDVAYGGAFYAIISARELGFEHGLQKVNLAAVTQCMNRLKPFLSTHPVVVEAVQHRDDSRLSFLYSIMIVDDSTGYRPAGVSGRETGLCYFADNEIDRSPTGSCVSARIALKYSKGQLSLGEKWAYNSLVSNHFREGAFIGKIEKILGNRSVIVRVEGAAYYIGTSAFICEKGDHTSQEGFILEKCA